MVIGRVSVILPSRNERFLTKTVIDLLAKAQGDVEIIPVLEGYWPTPALPEDPRIHILHNSVATGMRNAINAGVAMATGEFIMKLDGHCMVSDGFDVVLKAECERNWIVVPRRYSLEPEEWVILDNGKAPVDYHYLSFPFQPDKPGRGLHGSVWNDRARKRKDILLDEEMSSQGSCWFMHRNHWDTLIGPMQCEGYGRFAQEFQELGNKTWLSGGKVMINKKAWYAHLHKGSKYGRGYSMSSGEMNRGVQYAVELWVYDQWEHPLRVHSLEWLIDHFWPVPTWPDNWTSALPPRGTFTYNMKEAWNVPVVGMS